MLNVYQFDQRFRKLDPEPKLGLWSSSRRFKFFGLWWHAKDFYLKFTPTQDSNANAREMTESQNIYIKRI
jgi:hypothetical protein